MTTILRDDIYWVGHIDWNVRDFHGYHTHRGSTYNAYLVRDVQTALIDTVKAPYADHLLRQVAAICAPEQVAYVVCNHAEPDHAGALAQVLAAFPQATLVCNRKCAAALGQYFDTANWRIRLVSTGERLPLGRRTLEFVETPMVHWPESMFTYVPEERVLFSMDAFGQHYASATRFDDEQPPAVVMDEAKTYYANIVMPYAKAVADCLEAAARLPVEMIAPSHGVIWRKEPQRILAAYRAWSSGQVEPKVAVIYDTMWKSTTSLAEAIVEGASQPGVSVLLLHARRVDLTRIATEVLDAAALGIGSATLNRQMLPAMAAVLCYLEGLRPTGKAALAFGSYGWGRGGPEAVHAWLEKMGWEILEPPIRAAYRPTAEVLEQCQAAGRKLAQMAVNKASVKSA